jgi:hypothetical protein
VFRFNPTSMAAIHKALDEVIVFSVSISICWIFHMCNCKGPRDVLVVCREIKSNQSNQVDGGWLPNHLDGEKFETLDSLMK